MREKLIEAIREVPISQTYEDYVEALADRLVSIASEVAEEIFEQIEYLIWQNDTHPASELTEALAELKKKYTEEGK